MSMAQELSMNPRISVIIPTYNGSLYIAEAIESVLNQTYTEYEIIVIDDGSTDNTCLVLKPYMEKIRYIYQENQGVAIARNHGIQEASGELIAFLDADDFWILPTKLEEQVACFDKEPEVGIVQSGWRLVDRDGKNIVDKEPWQEAEKLDLRNWLLWGHVLPSAIMIRKEWLERVNGFDPRFSHGEDMDLILRIAVMGCKSTWFKKITACYRQHPLNATRRLSKQVSDLNSVWDNFFSRADIPEDIRELEPQSCYYNLIWLALCFYEQKEFSSMAECFKKSLKYNQDKSVAQIIARWVEIFKQSTERNIGHNFDIHNLTQLPEWQNLIQYLCLEDLSNKTVITTSLISRRLQISNTGNYETYPRKVNIVEARQGHYGFHRSGIHYALEGLMPLNHEQGIFVDASIERKFAWNIAWTKPEDIQPYQQPWIGFIYVAPKLPKWFDRDGYQSPEAIFQSDLWKESIKTCGGIFCLSEYHKKWLQVQLEVPVESLILPTETPHLQFSIERFLANPHKKLVQIGWWLRKLHSIYYFPQVTNLEKSMLDIDVNYIHDAFKAEKKALELKPFYKSVQVIPHLTNDEYDELLSQNIVYLEMYDSCSNNILSECLVRNTPLLVNPLPAVIEYLGEDYPFYFESRTQAAKKVGNFALIEETYNYLKNHPLKEKMTAEYFLKSFAESTIYKNLPTINS